MERTAEIIGRTRFVIENGSHVRDSILIVLDGRFQYSVDGENCIAGKNSICVFPKGVLFQRKVIEPIRCVYFQFEEFPEVLPAGLLQSTDEVRTENTIGHLARAVEEENEVLTEHFLRDILLLCNPPKGKPGVRDDAVRTAISYMERNYTAQITLRELADVCAISQQTLIRKFRECTGKTPMQYLLSIRINEGKRLLRDTDLTASQIARECGFENVYYFSNCFMRASGQRPSQYRKNVDL